MNGLETLITPFGPFLMLFRPETTVFEKFLAVVFYVALFGLITWVYFDARS